MLFIEYACACLFNVLCQLCVVGIELGNVFVVGYVAGVDAAFLVVYNDVYGKAVVTEQYAFLWYCVEFFNPTSEMLSSFTIVSQTTLPFINN